MQLIHCWEKCTDTDTLEKNQNPPYKSRKEEIKPQVSKRKKTLNSRNQ